MFRTTTNRFLNFCQDFALIFGGFALISGGLTAIWAKAYWGYILGPPALPEKIREFDDILSVTPFETEFPDGGPANYLNSDDYLLSEHRLFIEPEQESYPRPYVDGSGIPHYDGVLKCNTEFCSPSRVLAALTNQGLLTEVKPILSQAQLTQVEKQLEQANLLLLGKPGYEGTALELRGLIVEAMADGQQYLFLAIDSHQISNDHHAYYEILFQQESLAAEPNLIASNRLYNDVSGLEGFDFQTVWIILLVGSLLPSLGIALLRAAFRSSKPSTITAAEA